MRPSIYRWYILVGVGVISKNEKDLEKYTDELDEADKMTP